MKAGLFTVAALAASATAQVHRAHRNLHKKRGDNVVVQYDYETVTAPQVIVYVDQYGNPISGPAAATAAPAPAAYAAPAPAAYAPPAAAPAAAQNTPDSPPAYQPAKSSAAPAPSAYTPSEPSSSSGLGMVYSPYTDGGDCKDLSQMTADFAKLGGYSLFRIYGTDCDQVAKVLSAKPKNAKLFAGVFNIDDVTNEINIIIAAAKNDWSSIDTISIGNELVNMGAKSPEQVVAAIGTARGLLKAAGYTGNVVTVDTFVAMIANPSLCEASDYAAANCHAFFDGGRTAEQAGQFVLDQSKRVADACGGKRVVITESGWPWQGNSNGAAVPSVENQKAAISGLKSAFSKDLILFTAFDELWKVDTADTHGCEKYYGILGH